MNWQIVEIINELVEVALRNRRGGFRLHVDEEPMSQKQTSYPKKVLNWRIGKMPSSSPVDLCCAPLPGAPVVGVLSAAHGGVYPRW
jgi:hypothetical protein